MVRMRTLDRTYLATHPAGDETATFSISMPVPASVDVPDNPDGTRPKITLKATSDTYSNLLGILSYVHDEDVAENAVLLVVHNVDEKELAPYETIEDAAPFIREAVAEIVSPFRTFTLELGLQAGDDEETFASGVLELTAPSMISAAQALKAMTKPRVLTELAISFCPETDDEDDYADSNEVLVVS